MTHKAESKCMGEPNGTTVPTALLEQGSLGAVKSQYHLSAAAVKA